VSMLVPQTARPLVSRRQAHPANVVQGVGEGLAADIRVFRVDQRTLMYVVRVASMHDDAAGRLTGVLLSGEPADLGGLSIAAGSVGCARLAVVPPSGGFAAVYLEIRSPNALLRVEAPRLPARRKKPFLAVASIVTAIAASAASAAFYIPAQPHPKVIVTQAAPAPAPIVPARILSLSVRRDMSVDGETVLASYMAVGDGGSFALVDSRGKVIASAPFTHVGTTRLAIAPKFRFKPLMARLVVHRGATSAVASVSTLPTIIGGAAPDDGSIPEAVTPLDPVSARTAFTGIMGAESRPVAGHLLKVRLMPNLNVPHIELQDGTGATLAERDVPSGTTTLTLPLPPAAASQTYYLSLRYMKDGAEETIVRTIVAAAR
jgi:hypothetical protein